MDNKEEAKEIWERLSYFYIDYIIALQDENIVKDFKDFPDGLPSELRFKNYLQRESSKPKLPKVKVDPEMQLMEEATKFIANNIEKCKRRSRYSGSYSIEALEEMKSKQLEANVDVKVENNKKPKEIKNESLKIVLKTEKKKGTRTLSDTSSSDDDEEDDEKLKAVISTPKSISNEGTSNSDSGCVNDDNYCSPTLIKKLVDKHEITECSVALREVNVETEREKLKVVKTAPKNKGISKLKLAFDATDSFDEAMKKYSEELKKDSKPKVLPTVIPPPQQDPSIKKKKPKKTNPLEHLGGIFTINNGWDKADEEFSKKPKVTVNREDRNVTPPPKHMSLFDRDIYDEDLLNNNYGNKSQSPRDPRLLKNETIGYVSFSPPKNNNQEAAFSSSSSDEEEEEKIAPTQIKKSIFDSDNDDDNEEETVEKKDVTCEKKAKNISEVNLKSHCDNSDDAISLDCDFRDLNDFKELEEDPEMSTELNDLKIKMKKQKRVKKPVSPKSEFDVNTKQIEQYMVDPETDKILKDVFGNVCPAYLESRCELKDKCTRVHSLVDCSSLRATLIYARSEFVEKVFGVACRFSHIFFCYVTVFTEVFVNSNNQQGLIDLVKGCGRYPRTIPCLKTFVRKTIDLNHWKVHDAINFVIANHEQSKNARELILEMILDSGPCIPYFMPYIEFLHQNQPINIKDFEKILHACVAYTNPKMPYFCLNFLNECDVKKINQLNQSNLLSFIQMNQCFTELNETRESKLISVLKKMQNM